MRFSVRAELIIELTSFDGSKNRFIQTGNCGSEIRDACRRISATINGEHPSCALICGNGLVFTKKAANKLSSIGRERKKEFRVLRNAFIFIFILISQAESGFANQFDEEIIEILISCR